MSRGSTQAQNHPRSGSTIKVEPIRDLTAIQHIKERLRRHNLRNYCLFTLGINTAYRASELLSLTVGQVKHLQIGDLLDIKQKKTKEYRAATLNHSAVESIQTWLAAHPLRSKQSAPLFLSQRRYAPLCVSSLSRLVKSWCQDEGLTGNYASHSLRKTWGYHQRVDHNAPIPLLMRAYGHKSQTQTMTYLHIQEQELQALYIGMEL